MGLSSQASSARFLQILPSPDRPGYRPDSSRCGVLACRAGSRRAYNANEDHEAPGRVRVRGRCRMRLSRISIVIVAVAAVAATAQSLAAQTLPAGPGVEQIRKAASPSEVVSAYSTIVGEEGPSVDVE